MADIILGGSLVFPKAAGAGIKVDQSTPDYPWVDWHGWLIPDIDGANRPTLAAFRGNVREYSYAVGDKLDMKYHVPHDYAGTDIHLHLHWAHVGTAISGSFILDYAISYSKGHNQADYSVPITPQQTISAPDIATVPQYRHRIDEFQLSAASPSATQLQTSLLEPDGVILVNLTVNTIPTITGGTTAEPFIHYLDIHAQSMAHGTKNKAPNFYT